MNKARKKKRQGRNEENQLELKKCFFKYCITGQKGHDRDKLSMNKARKKKDKEEMKRTRKS